MSTEFSRTRFNERLAALSPAQRALFEKRLMQQNQRREAAQPAIERQTDRKAAPLSYNQEDLWITNQLMPLSSFYHTPTAARLTGNLNVDALKLALAEIVARHDALRTTFTAVDGTANQVVHDSKMELPLIDLAAIPDSDRQTAAAGMQREEPQRQSGLS